VKAEDIARLAHEVNRAYCAGIGDHSQVPWDNAPQWQRDSVVAGISAHLVDMSMTPEQSHAKWVEFKAREGWSYGPVKCPELMEHPCMLPYDQLPKEQRVKDYLFRAVVHTCAEIV
jgi:hypothetical protein